MDTIFTENYIVEAKHRYYKEDDIKKQKFIVSVYAHADTKGVGATDDLRQTLNYEIIRKYIHDVLMQSPHNLLESLAEEIGGKILVHNVTSVEVTIKNPDVWSDCTQGVRITRRNKWHKSL